MTGNAAINKAVLNKIFSEVLNEFQLKWIERQCPDQYIFTFDSLKKYVPENWERKSISFENPKNKKIILILESPHYDEFLNAESKPANGKTGKNLTKGFINKIFEHCKIQKGVYDVYIVNSIQYQCSLGTDPEVFRDIFFNEIWKNGGKKNFIERIGKLKLNKSDYIVNCCTIGSHKKVKELFDVQRHKQNSLRDSVQRELVEINKTMSFQLKIATHPSSWRIKNEK